jgi:hypothetical protein
MAKLNESLNESASRTYQRDEPNDIWTRVGKRHKHSPIGRGKLLGLVSKKSATINATYNKATVKSNVAGVVGDMEVIHKFINVRKDLGESNRIHKSEGA